MFKPFLKTISAVAVCALLSAGCAATRDLLSTETYRKEIISHGRTSFCRVWAIEEAGGFRVSGELHLRGAMKRNIPDFVDVSLVGRAGSVIAAQKVLYYPRALAGRKFHREARFSAWFVEIPPAGTTIRVSNVD